MHKPLFCTSSAETRALKQGGEEPETGWFIKLIGMPLDGSCRTGWMKGPPASLPPDSLRGRGREGGGKGGGKKPRWPRMGDRVERQQIATGGSIFGGRRCRFTFRGAGRSTPSPTRPHTSSNDPPLQIDCTGLEDQ